MKHLDFLLKLNLLIKIELNAINFKTQVKVKFLNFSQNNFFGSILIQELFYTLIRQICNTTKLLPIIIIFQ